VETLQGAGCRCESLLHDPPPDLKAGTDSIAVLGGIWLQAVQQFLRFSREFSQLLDLALDYFDPVAELICDIAAGQLTGIINRQAAGTLYQGEPQSFGPADELQAAQAALIKQALTVLAAHHRLQEAEILVAAQGFDRQAAARGQRPDPCAFRPTDLTLPLEETLMWNQVLSLSIP